MVQGLAPISFASAVVGFISFAITLLTLGGVYRDLISTMRKAPSQIPVVLGNLRQELLSERAQLRRKIRRCRDPHHVQITHKGLMTRLGPPKEEVMYLFQRTMRDLWTEFKNLERPFLVASGRRAESIRRGDYWGESDVEEKAGAESPKIATDGATYYLTDFSHRFIWWQCKDDVNKLADQVQRIQIRRIERDVFETEELARRCLSLLSGGGGGGDGGRFEGEGSGGSGGSDNGGGGGGGGRAGVRMRRRVGVGAGADGSGKRSRSVSLPPPPIGRARSVSRVGGGMEHREGGSFVKVRGDTTTDVDGERPPAAESRRRERDRDRDRDRGARFEAVRPGRDASGRILVDMDGGPVDVERKRDTRDRDRERNGPAPVYVERERSRFRDRDRYK